MNDKNEVVERLKAPLNVCDSTLKAGEQAAGTIFSNIEKYRIAQMLSSAGVPQIEVGIPSSSEEERKAIKHIANMGLNSSIMASGRDTKDIDVCVECGVDSISINLPSSDALINAFGKDREWILNKVYESASHAAEHGLYISCVAEDASKADIGFLIDFAKTAKDAGADRFGYEDTLSADDPFSCSERIKMINQIGRIDMEIISNNDFGMATANAIAAVKSGAKFVRTTSLGIGQRAGCASLEEVVMAAKHILKTDSGIDCTKLRDIAECVSKASGITISQNSPIIGSNCFAKESGFLNNPAITEPYDPAEVGASTRAILGKHAVRNAILMSFSGTSVKITPEDAERLAPIVRKAAYQMHRSLSTSELLLLYEDMMSDNPMLDDSSE